MLLVKNRVLFGVRYGSVGPQIPILEWGQGDVADTGTVRLTKPFQVGRDGDLQWIDVDCVGLWAVSSGRSILRQNTAGYGNDHANWRITPAGLHFK